MTRKRGKYFTIPTRLGPVLFLAQNNNTILRRASRGCSYIVCFSMTPEFRHLGGRPSLCEATVLASRLVPFRKVLLQSENMYGYSTCDLFL